MYAEVIVDVSHQAVDQIFDYAIPASLAKSIEVGQRVEIPFGPRFIVGTVMKIKASSDIENIKPIHGIRDAHPYYSEEHLALASTLAKEHFNPLNAYLSAMIPNALSMRYQTQFTCLDKDRLPKKIQPLFDDKNTVTLNKSMKSYLPQFKEALLDNAVSQTLLINEKTGIKTIDYVRLVTYEKVTGAKQQAILDYLKNHSRVKKHLVLEETSASLSSLKALVKKGYIEVLSIERYREKDYLYKHEETKITLNKEQALALKTIVESLNHFQPLLLHGVTSSGKTEVYLKATEQVLKQGKTVLMLVSEISLTPKITARFRARFKGDVAVYHSGLTAGEQYDEWRKIMRGEVNIVIGTRSSIFAPLKNIGLIILDEEHSDSYIQTEPPRYHAKDVAFMRGKSHNAPVLLGSATPSVESYYHAKEGNYRLITLKERALSSVYPHTVLVDMKEEFKTGNKSIFSEALKTKLLERFNRGEQSLLLINRRGHANFVLCRSCGETISCDDCAVSMTYHKQTHSLKCHYCSHEKPMPHTCPKCDSPHIRFMGLGSERVEEALKTLIPSANIIRMDRDTVSKKDAHEQLLYTFENEGDILVGTQMIAKGLDFDRVTLVGILSADMALFVPQYFAKEEAFSLLTQMAGRAGRRAQKGDVVIQAYDTTHPVLTDVINHDYAHFYAQEITYRKYAMLPPFMQITQIMLTSPSENGAFKEAMSLMKKLEKSLKSAKILGPVAPYIAKLKNEYRCLITVKTNDKEALQKVLTKARKNQDTAKIKWHIDPYGRMN